MLVLAAPLAACAGARPVAAPAPGPSAIRYEVALKSAEPWVLDVRVRFEGGVGRAAIKFPPGVGGLVVEEGGRERTPEAVGRAWKLACASTCTARYSFDLSSAAAITQDAASVAVRSGGDVLSPGDAWMLRAEPVDARAAVTLRVDTRDPARPEGEPYRFAAPFPRDEATGEYRLVARDIAALGYTMWGRFSVLAVPATRGQIDVAVLGGARAADDATIARWVTATAHALDTVYGRFPIDHVLVAVVPSPDSDAVDFGRTVPAGGASILMYVGERAGEKALMDDWVLAHEFFHLGVPSMPRDGRWLDEGLATYYEPVLRARAGLRSIDALWAELRSNMARGVSTAAEPSLAVSEDHDRVYYGGSSFALTADVEIRRRTGAKKSLDDGLRQVLAEGGKATEVWSVAAFIAALDRGVGMPVVRELFERTLPGAAPCAVLTAAEAAAALDLSRCAPDDDDALARLFTLLGVGNAAWGGLAFDEAAPFAEIRDRIGRLDPEVAALVASGAPRGVAGMGARTRAGVEKP